MSEDIVKIKNDLFDNYQDSTRRIMERIWWRNILYYAGEQYIEWNVAAQIFQRHRKHIYTPKPKDNIVRDFVNSKKALMLSKEYKVRVYPNSEEQEDIEAALLGEELLKYMDISMDEEFAEEKEKAVLWLLIAGTSFIRTFPAKDRGEWGMTKKGEIIPAGEVISECISPFNIYLDSLGTRLRDKRYVGIQSIKPKEWVEDTFKKKVSPDSNKGMTNYANKLMKFVGSVSPWQGAGLNTGEFDETDKDAVLFREIEFKPTKDRPNGRYVVMVGDDVMIDKDELIIPVEKGNWFYTVEDIHYHLIPGRYWSDSAVTDLISPQNAINEIDQAFAINRKSLGKPWLMKTVGTKLRKDNKFDRSVKTIEWDPRTAMGHKPEIHPGVQLPNQLMEERNNHIIAAQNAAGDPKNILKGQTPTSQASGYMVDVLRETAEVSHAPDIHRYRRALRRIYRRRLMMAQKLYTEKRTIKIVGEGNDLAVKMFKGADLRGNHDVRLELDSGASFTQSGQTQIFMNMLQSGAVDAMDPDVRHELFVRLGAAGIREKIDVHTERANCENTEIKDGKLNTVQVSDENGSVAINDPLFELDDHATHYEVHRKFALSKEFKALKPEQQTVLLFHIDVHQDQLVQQETAAVQAQMVQQNPELMKGPEALPGEGMPPVEGAGPVAGVQ